MNENGNAFQHFAFKGKSNMEAPGGGGGGAGASGGGGVNICLFAINKICSIFLWSEKMEMAF